MSNVAVIAEFHPYHNGHHYLFEEAMSLSHADHAIALMSGNFLQRGSIALWDKYTRAEMAVADGFDLCLELPFVYATGSAGDFADGAVAILKNLHTIDYLAFGVEEAEPELFEQVAEVLTEEPENYQLALKQALKNGASYPKARQMAIKIFASRLEISPRTMARYCIRGCWLSYLRSARLSIASDAARADVSATVIQRMFHHPGCPPDAMSAPM